MRTTLASAVAILVLSAQVLASPRTSDNPNLLVTLLIYVDDTERLSPASMEVLKTELRSMLDTEQVRFNFINPDQAKPPAYFQSLVSVRLTGICNIEGNAIPDKGPLAFAHSSDGRILPFVEVQCDRIRRHVRSAFWGPDCERAVFLYGRALARVVAHELYHVLTGRKEHTSNGLTRPALTGEELISDEYQLEHTAVSLMADAVR